MTDAQWKMIYRILCGYWDKGPPDEGWQSDELAAAISALEQDHERLEWLLTQNEADVMWNSREEVDAARNA